jgi:hypothetical protein
MLYTHCSLLLFSSMQEYDETKEFVINAEQEAAYNQIVQQRVQASFGASTGPKASGGSKSKSSKKGGGGKAGQAKGQPRVGGAAGGYSSGVEGGMYGVHDMGVMYGQAPMPEGMQQQQQPPLLPPLLSQQRQRGVSDYLEADAEARAAPRMSRKQYARLFMQLIENQGSWERARVGTSAVAQPSQEAWEGLVLHAPELVDMAARTSDLASSTQYFEVRRWGFVFAGGDWGVSLMGQGVAQVHYPHPFPL